MPKNILKRNRSTYEAMLQRKLKGSVGPVSEQEENVEEELVDLEQERLAKEAAEKLEQERLAKEAAEKLEQERLAKEAAEKAEQERLAKEAAEKAEQERLAKEAAEKLEQERLAKEAAEKLEQERLAKEAAEKAEQERLAKEAEEARRLAAAAELEALKREQVTVQEAHDVVSDEIAEALIEKEEETEKIYGNKKGIINLDIISKNFNAGDTVTVNILKEKKLIDKNVNFIKVLARGVLDKPLTIKAQDFSLDAAKMIELTGGHVVMLTKRKYFN